MQNFGVLKKNKIHTFEYVHACTVARNVKGACMLTPISQVTYIPSENFQKMTLSNIAGANQVLNGVANGLYLRSALKRLSFYTKISLMSSIFHIS